MNSKNTRFDEQQLVDAATKMRQNAHAPYSGYKVGSALMDDNGQIYCGCNVENAAFRIGTCAEANAICAMVAAGGKKIVAIAAVGGAANIEACTPCGGCRQSIREFSDADTRVFLLEEDLQIISYSIEELLPASFSLEGR